MPKVEFDNEELQATWNAVSTDIAKLSTLNIPPNSTTDERIALLSKISAKLRKQMR